MAYSKISGFSDEIAKEVDTQFQVLNKLGISYFEPRGINGKSIAALDEQEVLELKAKMDQYGIKASSIGSPVGKVMIEEPFEPHFAVFQRIIQTAQRLECRFVRMFSFFHATEGEWTVSEREEVLARLRKMIAYAAERDVVLLHENEKDIYGETVDHCLDLMQELYCDHFQAVFDPANFVQAQQNTKEGYEKLKPYIAYMHIKDARFSDGVVVPSGMGDGNVEYILRELFTHGYTGFLSLEPHLGRFVGLADLEHSDMIKKLPEGGEGTFTLAYNALTGILDKISV